ncbi:LuxR family transcriptional regulator [Legionella geestiana]|nr:LuxR family transcriptional regulator [Legionella geestiana]
MLKYYTFIKSSKKEITMQSIKRILITGHPGTGKALVARQLAKALGWEFINTDFELEQRSGRNIDAIMGSSHNNPFYEFEIAMLLKQLEKTFCVINTDPHIVCLEPARAILSDEFVVYLKASTHVQMERSSGHVPPLYPDSDLSMLFETLHTSRDNLYEETASLVIDTDDSAIEQHIKTVIEASGAMRPTHQSPHEHSIVLFHQLLHTPVKLSRQQTACMKLLAEGLSAKEIARRHRISHRTVEGTLARIMEIAGCTSSKELVSLYLSKP